MCACTATWQCSRHQRGGLWQSEEWDADLLDDPRFDALQDQAELLSLAEFRREAQAALGAVTPR